MTDISFTTFSAALAQNEHPTSMQIYDSDPVFQQDADKMVYLVQRTLGSPVLESEISLYQIWDCFEQATLEFSMEINKHHAKNILVDLLGQPTGSLSGSENAYVLGNSAEFARRLTLQYAYEIGANSPWAWNTGSIDLIPGQQTYDLMPALSASLTGSTVSGVQIRKIHHYEPVAAYRFFDTTSVLNFLGNNMNFSSYSPETIFYMLPIWEDVLRGVQLEFNQRVRRSQYSFEIRGFKLKLYPVPNRAMKLWYEWTSSHDPLNNTIGGMSLYNTKGVTSNLSNVAFGHLGYSGINSIGRTWIWKMTVAMVKERLALIRGKFQSIPIPNGEVNINWQQLQNQAEKDMENLRQELKETLDQLSYKNIAQEKNDLQELAIKEWNRLPKFVYRSR
jgi:hypothetical protein